MAGRGRKPKPTKLRIIQGNPGKRPLNKQEPHPKVEDDFPSPPPGLPDKAIEAWNEYGPELYSAGLLTKLDAPMLEQWARAYADWKDALDRCDQFGKVIKTTNGNVIHSPYWSIANKAQDHLLKIQSEFGMSPTARTRIQAGGHSGEAGNPFECNGRKTPGN